MDVHTHLAALAHAPQAVDRVTRYPGLRPNWALPTAGGAFAWQTLADAAGWRLQRHKATGHCRLLAPDDRRIAWGPEASLRQALATALTDPPRGASPSEPGPDDMLRLTDSLNVVREFVAVAQRRLAPGTRLADALTGEAAARAVEVDAHVADALEVVVGWLEAHADRFDDLDEGMIAALGAVRQLAERTQTTEADLKALAARIARLEDG